MSCVPFEYNALGCCPRIFSPKLVRRRSLADFAGVRGEPLGCKSTRTGARMRMIHFTSTWMKKGASRCNGGNILEGCSCRCLPSLGRFEELRYKGRTQSNVCACYQDCALRIGHCGRCVVSSLEMDETMGRYSLGNGGLILSLVEVFLIPF